MNRRMVAIQFPYLLSDWMLRRRPELREVPFGLATTERGRRVLKALNRQAARKGLALEMVVADCKALVPELQVFEFDPDRETKLLHALAGWCIRYTPFAAVDLPDGMLLDASGCTHLWGGEQAYLRDIEARLQAFGYSVRLAMADTIGAAWAVSRFGHSGSIIAPGKQLEVLSQLPAAALRPEPSTLERLEKLGLSTVGSFIHMPRTALRRRFGQALLTRIAQALGETIERPEPVRPPSPFEERLPCLEPIRTAKGIEIALQTLLDTLCERLTRESKGLRRCELRCYRVDGAVQKIETGTSRPVRNAKHLFRLFELKIAEINPGLGIELFVLEAPVVEELLPSQDALWATGAEDEAAIAALLDRLAGKLGHHSVHRYLPAQHYWPERAVREARSLDEQPDTSWRKDLPRPVHLLAQPEPIEVSVPIPDYPPMLFRYKGEVHAVKKADGPERIEQEWWIQAGLYRDYYCVEDEAGARYWLFRSGDYASGAPQWFIHGFFA